MLQAGHPVDVQDNDGWTPLHAAAHWGEKQACETLVEHMARMDVKNSAGHTCFDLADEKVLPILEELEKKQAEVSNLIHLFEFAIKRLLFSGKKKMSLSYMNTKTHLHLKNGIELMVQLASS